MTLIKRDNFITIQGWMLTDLGLKGSELLIYACIYGFSQDRGSRYTGSAQYLADWTNTTKKSVFQVLKNLTERGLIIRDEEYKNNILFVSYSYNPDYLRGREESSLLVKSEEQGREESSSGVGKKVPQGREESSSNNIDKKIVNRIEDNKDKEIFSVVIDFLNKAAGTQYKASSKDTRKHIRARISEGFTLEDFKTVISNKVAEWKGTQMEIYIRPATLFGTKFEAYLNQRVTSAAAAKSQQDIPLYDQYMQ